MAHFWKKKILCNLMIMLRWQVTCCMILSPNAQSETQRTWHTSSVTRLGDFFKVLGNKFTLNSGPKRLLTFGLLRKQSINVKTALDIIQVILDNTWETF